MMQDEWIDIPSYEDVPTSGGSIPTMEIKNSYGGGSFADTWGPALEFAESNYNPNAVGPATRFGTAKGAYQVLDSTGLELAQKLGIPQDQYNPFDYDQNRLIGRTYLNQMYDKYGTPELAFAAYNFGPGNLDKKIAQAGTKDFNVLSQYLPAETQNYVPKIMSRGPANASQYGSPNMQDEWVDVPSIEDVPTQATDSGSEKTPDYVPDANQPVQPTEQAPQTSYMDYANNLAAQAVNSTGFNFVDNVRNLYKQAPEVVQDAIGAMPGVGGVAKNYLDSEYLDTKKLQDFKKENPKASLGASLAGALMQPASLVSSLPRAAGSSIVSGFGDRVDQVSSPTSNRGMSELGVGALVDALLGSGGYLVAKGAGKVYDYFKAPKLTAGEKAIGNTLEKAGASTKTLQDTKTALQESTQPLFLPEALDSGAIKGQARQLATDLKTRDVAETLIQGRQADDAARLSSVLDEIGPLQNPSTAGKAIKSQAEKVMTSLNKEKTRIGEETYGPIWQKTPTIPLEMLPAKFVEKAGKKVKVEDEIPVLLRSKYAQKAVAEVKSGSEFMDTPLNDAKLLHSVKSELYSAADAALNAGKKAKYGRLTKEAQRLEAALDENVPGLAAADETYKRLIQNISEVGDDTLLGMATRKGNLDLSALGGKILTSKTAPEEVQALIKNLGPDGETLVANAVRAKISDDIANKAGEKGISSVFDKVAIKNRLEEILGPVKAKSLINKLDQEVKIRDGYNNYKFGSQTFPGFKEDEIAQQSVSKLVYALKNPVKTSADLVGKALGNFAKTPDSVLQDQTKIMFSKDNAIEALANILKSKEYYENPRAVNELLQKLLTRGAQEGMNPMNGGRQ